MPFSAYDSNGLRLLSAALSDALKSLQSSIGRTLTESETADFSQILTQRLMRVYDTGERDPAALKRAAVEAVLSPPERSPGPIAVEDLNASNSE